MAGLITHLVIGHEILDRLPNGIIKDEDLFYAGTIAPDAIHARKGYVRAFKKHTHMRDDISDKDFKDQKNLDIFHKRVADFIRDAIDKHSDVLDLYRGYAVHLLTDELFVLTIREDFVEAMENIEVAQSDKQFLTNIVENLDIVDLMLVSKFSWLGDVLGNLKNLKPYCVDGYLTAEELAKSSNWVIDRYMPGNRAVNGKPKYFSFDRMIEFINMAVENIIDRLSENSSLPRML